MYPTVEHAYQAAKTLDGGVRKSIRTAETAGKAKKIGNSLHLRSDWEDRKLPTMEELLRKKFNLPYLSRKLVGTSGELLIEGNTWGDHYWGVCDGWGENNLGKLLMRIRDELLLF